MSDAMQVAHQNRKDYRKAIAAKEAEIAELQEMIADLDSFIEFGNSLLGKGEVVTAPTATPVAKEPTPERVKSEWNTGDANDGIASVLSKRAG